MKRLAICVLWTTALTGLACAGVESIPNPAWVALPQPSTILICAGGLAFFRYIEKRVP